VKKKRKGCPAIQVKYKKTNKTEVKEERRKTCKVGSSLNLQEKKMQQAALEWEANEMSLGFLRKGKCHH
jgi:hypothetical protein